MDSRPGESRSGRSLYQNAATGLFLIALSCTLLSSATAVHLWLLETESPSDTASFAQIAVLALTGISATATVFLAVRDSRRERRRLLFSSILFLMIATVTIVSAELTARVFVPAWPAMSLHGVPANTDTQPWGLRGPLAGQVGYNSWGQRDRERTLRPLPGVRRVAFIGDSFLDDSTHQPLSLVVEQELNDPAVEVINLGVSATAPDEYYDRLARVAIPLQADSCVMFLYLGNDLAAGPRTLSGTFGFCAVSPRASLLTDLHLHGLNHLLTNPQRPVLQAWGSAGELARSEIRLHTQLQAASDAELVEILLSLDQFPPPIASELRRWLSRQEMAPFYEILRHPDADLFRSYFLVDSLWLAATGRAPGTIDDIESARHWIGLSHRLCQQQGLDFLMVVIPQGFAVDHRLQQQWSPLAEVARLTDQTEAAGQKLIEQLNQDGVPLLDLHPMLRHAPGAYLNLDGHWSELGIERVAKHLQEHLTQQRQAADAQ